MDQAHRAPSRLYRGSVWAARLLFSLFLFVGTCELLVRYQKPLPKFQMVRTENGRWELYEVDGNPVWKAEQFSGYWNAECAEEHPDRPRTLLLGSSIFFGSGVQMEQVFSRHLSQEYGDERCVLNFASPAFTMQTKYARALEVVPQFPNAHVVLEIWDNDPYDYHLLRGTAYSLRGATVDTQGYPTPFGVPAPINGLLFNVSAAYAYGSLAFSEPVSSSMKEDWKGSVIPRLDAIKALVEANGSTLSLVFMPALRKDPMPTAQKRGGYKMVLQWAESNQVPWSDAGALLGDQSVKDVRHDPCCHLNPNGHRLLAERLHPHLPR